MPPRSFPSTILRYWLSLLRQEEALTTRPKARRFEHPSVLTATSVSAPNAGQDYVKLPFEQSAEFLAGARSTLNLPVTGECGAFFEHWLAQQYRKFNEDGAGEHLVFFPAILTQRQELAGLLRFGVRLEWTLEKGNAFAPPSALERAKKRYPEPPSSLRVFPALDNEEGSALSVDTRVLQETLRVDLDRLESWLGEFQSQPRKPMEVLKKTSKLLADQIAADGGESKDVQSEHADDALAQLAELLKQRLLQVRSHCKAYEIAVLLDASRNRATFHVQRDLQAALELVAPEAEGATLPPDGPLATYLGGRERACKSAPLLGRFSGQPLTDSQRAAGELFLGSRLCAVQGPPGTGKTHLILSLAAQQMLENVLVLCEAKHPSEQLLVVTSTNNRAVDNVIDPLARDFPGLPLALRVGSREIMDRVTANELERVSRVIQRLKEPTDAEWDAATRRLKEQHEHVLEATRPEREVREKLDRREHLISEIGALQGRLGELERTPNVLPFLEDLDRARGHVAEVKAHVTALQIRLRALSALAEPSKRTALLALDQHFKLSVTRHLAPLNELLGSTVRLGLPPNLDSALDAAEKRARWEEATEVAIAILTQLEDWSSAVYTEQAERRRLAELQTQWEHLPEVATSQSPALDWSILEPRLHELFETAREVRELWAARHKKPLVEALQRAASTCKGQKSLRLLLTAGKGPGTWLARLFPVWGCTLLSLGNNFAPEVNSLARVVIDEAGQCHPAYAVSALLRASSALVIGDTNQLEPVVELSRADEARLLKGLSERQRSQLEPYRAHEGSFTSAQSVADAAVAQRPVLVDHFRCQAEIAAICEQLCHYGLVARTPVRSSSAIVPELDYPVLLTPVVGEQQRLLGSWCNEEEVTLVARWVALLLRRGIPAAEIGIITPFRGQLDLLWRHLRQDRVPLERPLLSDDDDQLSLLGGANNGVALGTVHRFQGGERRVILFSTAVTDRVSLRFLDERVNLINVAASRAKEHLVTVGHVETLRQGKNTRLLLSHGRERTL